MHRIVCRAAVQDSEATYQATWIRLAVLTGLALAVAGMSATYITVLLKRGFSQALELSGRVSRGNLNQVHQARSSNEFGNLLRNFDQMSERLHRVVSSVSLGAGEVSAGARDHGTAVHRAERSIYHPSAFF